MPSSKKSKTECLNPNTGRKMNIPTEIYNKMHAAIQNSLKNGKELTYTEIVESVIEYFSKKQVDFERSVEWYAVTVKHDMQSRGELIPFIQKGKKLHRLTSKK
ncbi:MAG: hypothetical protein C5B52_18340 [Bacteroidetes bacterium]|nr:MAG: hypothetical protein C5B52_18340 [Bacteroidota bacterium]